MITALKQNNINYNFRNFNYQKNISNKNISFSGIKPNTIYKTIASIQLGLIFYAGGLCDILNFQTAKNTNKYQWDENVRILAASSQYKPAFTFYQVNNKTNKVDKIYSDYLKKMYNNISQDNFNSIEQVNDSLVNNGYDVSKYRCKAQQTQSPKLNIFNKNDKNKDRFIVVFSQNNPKDKELIALSSNDFLNSISKTYNIPQDNILNISAETGKDFKNGINLITSKIDKLKNKNNVELMIVYNGHGHSRFNINPLFKEYQGSREGLILGKNYTPAFIFGMLHENDVKQFFKKKLKGIKTLFILNSCFSGAWTAKNTLISSKKIFSHFA